MKLTSGDRVIVEKSFQTDGTPPYTVDKGMSGIIQQADAEGDALIHFTKPGEIDPAAVLKTWILKTKYIYLRKLHTVAKRQASISYRPQTAGIFGTLEDKPEVPDGAPQKLLKRRLSEGKGTVSQAMANGVVFDIEISGAGAKSVNGVYKNGAPFAGKPQWEKSKSKIYWRETGKGRRKGGEWVITDTGSYAYRNMNGSIIPPEVGWVKLKGDPPAPWLRYCQKGGNGNGKPKE